jgi:hypothetical protein
MKAILANITSSLGIFFLSSLIVTCSAEDSWSFDASTMSMAGKYCDSQLLDKQFGLGFKLNAEYDKSVGATAGVRTTQLNLVQQNGFDSINQTDWLISAHLHTPINSISTRLTLSFDSHKIKNNDPNGRSDDVIVFAPQVALMSYEYPLTIDMSYAKSNYRNSLNVNQFSTGMNYGFNNKLNYLNLQIYKILVKDPTVYSRNFNSYELKVTHIIESAKGLSPNLITISSDQGDRLFQVNMLTQTVNNLSMINRGGESIALTWVLSDKTKFSAELRKNRYRSAIETPGVNLTNFSLANVGIQFTKKW